MLWLPLNTSIVVCPNTHGTKANMGSRRKPKTTIDRVMKGWVGTNVFLKSVLLSSIVEGSFKYCLLFIQLFTPFMFSFLGKGQAADLCVLESMRYWTTGSPCTMTTLHAYCVQCCVRCVYQTFPYSSLKTNIDSSEKKWANIRTFSPFGLFNEITFSKL